jgi:hypothetical protein
MKYEFLDYGVVFGFSTLYAVLALYCVMALVAG